MVRQSPVPLLEHSQCDMFLTVELVIPGGRSTLGARSAGSSWSLVPGSVPKGRQVSEW
jgi:hypothetical protein